MIDENVISAQRGYWEKRTEIGNLLLYPPFAFLPKDELGGEDAYMWPAKTKLGRKLENEFDDEINKVEQNSRREKTAETYSSAFADIEKSYKDDLDEARLWMKRYPEDRDTAMIESQKIKPINEKVEII